MFRIISLWTLAVFTITIFILYYIDRQKKRAPHDNPYITFIIPCYNDGHIIEQTIQSIYRSYDPKRFELIVVNDCSKDNSAKVIKSMQSEYDFTFIDLPKNGGKADALNTASKQAKYDIFCFVDADGIINTKALNDVLERFHEDPRMGAISCPYTPSNMGSFWAMMQDIEYTMLKFVQGCYNVTSALAARGGCLVVRKQAFQEVGMFSLHAITEDMDLALKMNEHHRHVQQSPCEIKSEVPDTFKIWLKQKIRRCSGGTQAFLDHFFVAIRNPMYIIFTILLFSVSIFGTIALVTRLLFFGEIIDIFMSVLDILTFKHGWNFIMAIYGNEILINSIQASAFTFLSLPYVLFAIKSKKERRKVLLLLPYTLFYMSLYSLVGLYSTFLGVYKFLTLEKGKRSW